MGMHQTHTYLEATILNLFTALNIHLSKPIRTTLVELIVCLLENNKAHLSKLGEYLCDNHTGIMSSIQQVRRFLSNPRISPSLTVKPLIYLMRPLLEKLPEIILIVDRTNWEKRRQHINILSVAVSYKGRALPLHWMVFGKKGNSSLEQWRQVLFPVIIVLQQMNWLSDKTIHIHVVADREFASPKLAEWLTNEFDVAVTLRIKANMYLIGEDTPEVKVASLIRKMTKGSRHVLYNQMLTRNSTFKMSVLLTWNEDYDEPLVVATTSDNPALADDTYEQRFNIEHMHKDWKSNAFDLEKTRVTDPKRIETLLIPIAFAYILCVLEGEQKEHDGEVRRPPKGKTRMVGLFLSGLRTISRSLQRESLQQFKRFILQLFQPVFQTWNIKPSTIAH
ncbi:MAG: IS4 family transposase [Candidatus Thermoplasmatota archaeon]|nr:IS4 family transposase [Candidatus Thermoplasmatota archaeon]